MPYCSLQHRILFPSLVTSTGCCLQFGSASSFFLELFLYSFPVAYWVPTDLEILSFKVISFCPFIMFMGFSRQEYGAGLPFPSPVDHIFFFRTLCHDSSILGNPTWEPHPPLSIKYSIQCPLLIPKATLATLHFSTYFFSTCFYVA